jgi:hypothetical protein
MWEEKTCRPKWTICNSQFKKNWTVKTWHKKLNKGIDDNHVYNLVWRGNFHFKNYKRRYGAKLWDMSDNQKLLKNMSRDSG